jgi:polyisoprenoid-binding protein YceI
MFKPMLLFVGTIGLASLQPAFAANDEWKIDPAHSDARFSVKHMMISNVAGDFGKITGKAEYDCTHLDKASVEATIPITDINTREPKRDEHLKSPEFFDVAKYPTMNFKSTKIEELPGGEFKMTGDLTMHGITKEVVLTGTAPSKPIKDPRGNFRIGTSVAAKINRKDFGINYDKTMDNGGLMVGDEVAVTIDIELTRPVQLSSN